MTRLTGRGVESPGESWWRARWRSSPTAVSRPGLAAAAVYHAQTFLAISQPLRAEDIRAIFPSDRLMVWEPISVYQYYRVTGEGRLLLGAADLRQTYARREIHSSPGVVRKMHRYLAEQFPSVRIELEHFWPGRLGVSKDFLPVLGRQDAPHDVYFAGAAAGLPWAAALGEYIADKITGHRDELDEVLSPSREYAVGSRLQRVLGRPASFALSHAAVKYLRRRTGT